MKTSVVTQEQIIKYYDSCEVDYSIVWHLKTHMSLHYGFWDEGIKRLRQALHRMNEVLAQKAKITAEDHVLDAGCGVGGASVYLAKHYSCKVDGITLSEKQVAFGNKKLEEYHLQDKVQLHVADYTRMPFEDESFDVVWAIESVCHAENKADFLKEAFRVLKKGGRLITADFYRTMEKPDEDAKKWLDNWGDSWAVPNFEYFQFFEQKAKDSGFEKVHLENITKNIYPSAKRLYYCFVPGIICDGFLRIFNKRNQFNKDNVWSTFYQYQALKRGYWNYYIVDAIKP